MKLRIVASETKDEIKTRVETEADEQFVIETMAMALGELAVRYDYKFDEMLQDIWRVWYVQNHKTSPKPVGES